MAILRITTDRKFNEISRVILPGPEPNYNVLYDILVPKILKMMEDDEAKSNQKEG